MKDQEVSIAGRKIGPKYEPYIIAEMSANHNGSIERALQTIDMVKSMGADAIKMQTYTADTITINCNKEDFQIHGGLWDGQSLYQLYESAHTPYEWHKPLFDHARKIGITCFSSPFDETAVDLLEDLNAPAYKIASFEVIDLPLIRYVALTGKPMIISTGMADRNEIHEAIETARENGCNELVLLHCISGYPVPVDQSNLRTIPDLFTRFKTVTGLSDHTLGTSVSVASVALGASVIEKHVKLDSLENGPDSEFSLDPEELKRLCDDTRNAWKALGKAGYERKDSEKDNLIFRRSIYIVKDIKAGEQLTPANTRRIRPGYGLAPKYYNEILGRVVKRDIEAGTALKRDMLQ